MLSNNNKKLILCLALATNLLIDNGIQINNLTDFGVVFIIFTTYRSINRFITYP